MGQVSFGCFSLIDAHGGGVADVIVAPEYILLQRGREAAVHDLSYLAVWSAERAAAVERELKSLAAIGGSVTDGTCPELRAILRAISPAATPIFVRLGQCSRAFVRRRLKAALRTSEAMLSHTA